MMARAWADHYMINFNSMVNFSKTKYRLLQDVQRSGLLNANAAEGLNPDEWLEEKGEGEDDDESAGLGNDLAIFEASEAGTAGVSKHMWMNELSASTREVENEQLIIGILCSAYPTNLAMRDTPDKTKHRTSTTSSALMDIRSVNVNYGKDKADLAAMSLPSPSFWLYSDMRMFNSQLSMQDTTLLKAWHVALFGGLRAKEDESKLELDGWLNIEGGDVETDKMVRSLRKEVRQAMVWVAISASWDKVAQAAVQRVKALFGILGNVLMSEDLDSENVEFLKGWELPTLEKGGATLEANEDDRENVEEMLWKKTVVELKVLLKEMKAIQTGRKADLVQRCCDALIYGAEATEGETDE